MEAHEDRAALEAKARAACEAGDTDAAATHLVRAYGADLFRFLSARLSDPNAAAEVYSDVVERLWRALPRFDWTQGVGVRGYCYAIARNAVVTYATAPGRRPERNLGLSQANLHQVAEQVRTSTVPYLRTEVKDRFRALREQLSEEDQLLLTLRVDRELEWRELAVVMTFDGSGQPPDEATLTREAARLRQRFKSAKEKLKRYAEREGLL